MKRRITLLSKTVLLCVLIIYLNEAFSQNKTIDSLQKVLQMQKEDTSKVNTLNQLSSNFWQGGDNKNGLLYGKLALALAEKLNFQRGKAKAYYNIAGCYYKQENYAEAIKYGYITLKYSESAADKQGIADALLGIGLMYKLQGNNDEALKALLGALKIREAIKDKGRVGSALNSIGGIYNQQGRYGEALKNEFAALKIFEEPGMPLWGLPSTYTQIGNVYEKQGDEAKDKDIAGSKYKDALKNYSMALKGWEKYQNKDGAIDAYVHLGSINFKLNNLPEAKKYLHMALTLPKENSIKESLKDAYLTLSKIDSTEGKYKEAYEHYKSYLVFRDSLVNQEGSRKTIQAKLQYESDKKEAIARVEQQHLKNRQLFIMASLGLLMLFVAVVAFIQWRNKQQKQKANILLQQQKEELQNTLQQLKATQSQLIQSEKMASLGELTAGIAHEIQNPLNFVNNFSEVSTELIAEMKQELKAGNSNDAIAIADDLEDNLEKINHHGKHADAIVKGMLQHSRASTGKKELTNINALADEYLRLAYHGFRAKDKSFNATIETHFDESIGKIEVIPQDIGRVLLNLFNNAFYAVTEKKKALNGQDYKPKVSVSTRREGDKVIVSVTDNGIGIPQKVVDKIFQPFFTTKPTGQGTGLGLSLSYDIIKAHGGEIKVETKEGEGAEFTIELPTKNLL